MQYIYMNQDIYNNKLKHKYTLTLLDPRLLYVGSYKLKETFPLGMPVQIRTSAFMYYVYYV